MKTKEEVLIELIKAHLYYFPWWVTIEKFGVSKTYLRKKCGFRPVSRMR